MFWSIRVDELFVVLVALNMPFTKLKLFSRFKYDFENFTSKMLIFTSPVNRRN